MAFTNSQLVMHTKLSPNYSSRQATRPDNKVKIDHIAIHCMAGNCSVETCGLIFQTPDGASSHYGIGSDGRIAMYVEEKHRAWCTGGEKTVIGYNGESWTGAQIDHRCVTIEVANTTREPNWEISDAAYKSLVKLCADICKRNGMKSLQWANDTKQVGNVAKQNITVHRWFAYKACPGDYIMSKLNQLCKDVNAALGSNTSDATSSPAAQPKADIYNFLKQKGLNDFAASGVTGNLYAESGLQSNNMQNAYEAKLGYTDATYTAAVDSGKYTNFVNDGVGYGLAQWTFYSRKQGLLDYAKQTKRSIGDSTMQMEYMWSEMQRYTAMMNTLHNAKSVREASDAFLLDFERPANQSEAVRAQRAAYGQEFYDKYANIGTPAVKLPYLVRVTADVLNIRNGPGTNYKINGDIRGNGIYTIVDESSGEGASLWGKLKSGAGWISLDYTKKQ